MDRFALWRLIIPLLLVINIAVLQTCMFIQFIRVSRFPILFQLGAAGARHITHSP
jgi:hypothetical protein